MHAWNLLQILISGLNALKLVFGQQKQHNKKKSWHNQNLLSTISKWQFDSMKKIPSQNHWINELAWSQRSQYRSHYTTYLGMFYGNMVCMYVWPCSSSLLYYKYMPWFPNQNITTTRIRRLFCRRSGSMGKFAACSRSSEVYALSERCGREWNAANDDLPEHCCQMNRTRFILFFRQDVFGYVWLSTSHATLCQTWKVEQLLRYLFKSLVDSASHVTWHRRYINLLNSNLLAVLLHYALHCFFSYITAWTL